MSGAATAAPRAAALRLPLPAVGAFAAYFALALFNGSQEPAALAGLCVAVAAGVTAVAIFSPRPLSIARASLPPLAAMLVLVLLIAGSAAWALDDGRVYVDVVRALAYLGALFILVTAVRSEQVRPILGGVAAAIVAIGALALGSRLLPGVLTGDATFLREFPADVRGRLSYPIGYWNGLAACMAGGVVLLSWLGGQAHGAVSRAAAVAAMPPLILIIYLSGSRGGLLAGALGVALMLALTPVRGRALAGVAIGTVGGLLLALAASSDQELVEGVSGRGAEVGMLALIAAFCLLAFLLRLRADVALRLPRLPRLLEGRWLVTFMVVALVGLFVAGNGVERVGDVSGKVTQEAGRGQFSGRFLSLGSNGRLQLWKAAVDAWESEPIHGIGAGAYGFWWDQHGTLSEPARDAHSLFFQSLAELGPLGLLAILVLLGSGFDRARRLTFGDRDGTVAALAGLLTAGVVGCAVDWTWEIPAAFGLNFLAIGLLCGPLSRTTVGGRAPAGRGLALRGIVAGVGAAAVVVAGALLLAERDLARSRELVDQGNYPAAAAAARDAARLQPASVDPWLQLGQVQTLAGDYVGGARSFEQAVKRSPESPQANLALAIAYHSIGDPRARDQQQHATALLPANR